MRSIKTFARFFGQSSHNFNWGQVSGVGRAKFHGMKSSPFRRQLGKQPLHFSDQFYRTIADEAYRLPVHLDRQLEALSRCFSKLTDRQKELVELKYRSQKNGSASRIVARAVCPMQFINLFIEFINLFMIALAGS